VDLFGEFFRIFSETFLIYFIEFWRFSLEVSTIAFKIEVHVSLSDHPSPYFHKTICTTKMQHKTRMKNLQQTNFKIFNSKIRSFIFSLVSRKTSASYFSIF
jgi:hypothetical protein